MGIQLKARDEKKKSGLSAPGDSTLNDVFMSSDIRATRPTPEENAPLRGERIVEDPCRTDHVYRGALPTSPYTRRSSQGLSGEGVTTTVQPTLAQDTMLRFLQSISWVTLASASFNRGERAGCHHKNPLHTCPIYPSRIQRCQGERGNSSGRVSSHPRTETTIRIPGA